MGAGTGMDYIFYYGPYQYKDCDTYTDYLERDWLRAFWDRGLPKHHKNMYYYLNAFPHNCGNTRPVGPESDPHSYLGFAKWLIQEMENGNQKVAYTKDAFAVIILISEILII